MPAGWRQPEQVVPPYLVTTVIVTFAIVLSIRVPMSVPIAEL
jgi:hypothetical protein